MSKTRISAGEAFLAFEELEEEIDKYQREHFVQFYPRDSRTIEATLKRAPKKQFNPNIKYSALVYSCIHGGKKLKSESKGKRPHQQ